MYNFDPYNVFLAIATNIPQRLMTGFIVQGHIKAFQFYKSLYFHMHFLLDILQKLMLSFQTEKQERKVI